MTFAAFSTNGVEAEGNLHSGVHDLCHLASLPVLPQFNAKMKTIVLRINFHSQLSI